MYPCSYQLSNVRECCAAFFLACWPFVVSGCFAHSIFARVSPGLVFLFRKLKYQCAPLLPCSLSVDRVSTNDCAQPHATWCSSNAPHSTIWACAKTGKASYWTNGRKAWKCCVSCRLRWCVAVVTVGGTCCVWAWRETASQATLPQRCAAAQPAPTRHSQHALQSDSPACRCFAAALVARLPPADAVPGERQATSDAGGDLHFSEKAPRRRELPSELARRRI